MNPCLVFCFYGGVMGHHNRNCHTKMDDYQKGETVDDQFGDWLRAPSAKKLSGQR